jgi:hypothetical protein
MSAARWDRFNSGYVLRLCRDAVLCRPISWMKIKRSFRSPDCSRVWRELEPAARNTIKACFRKLPKEAEQHTIFVPDARDGRPGQILVEYRYGGSLLRRRLDVHCFTLKLQAGSATH